MEPSKSLRDDIQQDNALMKHEPMSLDVKKVPNTLLDRLIQEVKTEAQPNILAYNRTHNRHNRGR